MFQPYSSQPNFPDVSGLLVVIGNWSYISTRVLVVIRLFQQLRPNPIVVGTAVPMGSLVTKAPWTAPCIAAHFYFDEIKGPLWPSG